MGSETYSLEVVTPPVTEPVTVAQAKKQCRVDLDDEDGLFETLRRVQKGLPRHLLPERRDLPP